MHFNGTAWTTATGPDLGGTSAISGTSDTDLWVLGKDGDTAHFNGSTWTTFAPAVPAGWTLLPGVGSDIYVAGPSDVWAGFGVITPKGDALAQTVLLEHFNGPSWSVATGVPDISADGTSWAGQVTGSGPDDVYVLAGVAFDKGIYGTSEMVHFNGSSWSVVSLPGDAVQPESMLVTGPGTGMVTGSFTSVDTSGAYIAQVVGGTWSAVSPPSTAQGPQAPVGLNPTSGAGKVWMEMMGPKGGDGPATLWQWSGGAWQQITNKLPVDTNVDVPGPVGIADGSGFWGYDYTGFQGQGGTNTLELYDAAG